MTLAGGRIVEAGGAAAPWLLSTLDAGGEHGRSIAELGIGTNPAARLTGSILEDEKVKGTVHLAFGTSAGIGGVNVSSVHIDGMVLSPDGGARREGVRRDRVRLSTLDRQVRLTARPMRLGEVGCRTSRGPGELTSVNRRGRPTRRAEGDFHWTRSTSGRAISCRGRPRGSRRTHRRSCADRSSIDGSPARAMEVLHARRAASITPAGTSDMDRTAPLAAAGGRPTSPPSGVRRSRAPSTPAAAETPRHRRPRHRAPEPGRRAPHPTSRRGSRPGRGRRRGGGRSRRRRRRARAAGRSRPPTRPSRPAHSAGPASSTTVTSSPSASANSAQRVDQPSRGAVAVAPPAVRLAIRSRCWRRRASASRWRPLRSRPRLEPLGRQGQVMRALVVDVSPRRW